MKLYLSKLLLALTFLIFIGCDSPMFNLEDRPHFPDVNNKTETTCDLEFTTTELCGEIKWVVAPSIEGESKLILTLKTASGQKLIAEHGLTLNTILWMPEHMHGSAPTKITPLKTPGQFAVDNIWFIMPGKWDIKFQIFEKDLLVDEDTITITL